MPRKGKTMAMDEERIRRYLAQERRRTQRPIRIPKKMVSLNPRKVKRRGDTAGPGVLKAKRPVIISSAFETNKRRH